MDDVSSQNTSAIKAKYNFYSVGEVSAFGAGATAGSGGSGLIQTVYGYSGLGGTSIAPQKVILGGTVIEPAVPVREGYSFSHWYLTDPQEAFDFSTAVYTDLVITAYWIPNTAGITKQVTFNSNGGSAVSPQEVAVGAVCKKPAIAELYLC